MLVHAPAGLHSVFWLLLVRYIAHPVLSLAAPQIPRLPLPRAPSHPPTHPPNETDHTSHRIAAHPLSIHVHYFRLIDPRLGGVRAALAFSMPPVAGCPRLCLCPSALASPQRSLPPHIAFTRVAC